MNFSAFANQSSLFDAWPMKLLRYWEIVLKKLLSFQRSECVHQVVSLVEGWLW